MDSYGYPIYGIFITGVIICTLPGLGAEVVLADEGALAPVIVRYEDALERMSVTQEFLSLPSLFYVCVGSE